MTLFDCHFHLTMTKNQGRIQDLIRGGPQIVTGLKLPFWGLSFVEFLVLGPHFWWSGGGPGPWGPPPGSAPEECSLSPNYARILYQNNVKRIKNENNYVASRWDG